MSKNKQNIKSGSSVGSEAGIDEEKSKKDAVGMMKAASVLFGMFLMGLISFVFDMVPDVPVISLLFGGYVLLSLYNRGVISKGD